MNRQVAALVPMRHNSERVPGKNYRMFGDAPLFHHIVRTLQSSALISEIIIDTDSPVIMEQCAETFPDVVVVERPIDLRDGDIAMNRIIEHDLEYTTANVLLQTHSTNPLLSVAAVDEVVQTYFDEDCDSVFTVTRLQQRLWRHGNAGTPAAVNHDPDVLLRTQDLEPLFIENSCAFVFSRQLIIETGVRIGARPRMVETDPIESLDIDEEPDFVLAEAMWEQRRTKGRTS